MQLFNFIGGQEERTKFQLNQGKRGQAIHLILYVNLRRLGMVEK